MGAPRIVPTVTLDSSTPTNIGDGTVRVQNMLVEAEGGDPSDVWLRFDGDDAKTFRVTLPWEGVVRAGSIEKHTSNPTVSALVINENDLGTHAALATVAVDVTFSGGAGTKRQAIAHTWLPDDVDLDSSTNQLRGVVR